MRRRKGKRLPPHLVREIREQIEGPEGFVDVEEYLDEPDPLHPRRRWVDFEDEPSRGRGSETRVYPSHCTSAYCGRHECEGCAREPVLREFKEWAEETGAAPADPIWSPNVYETPRDTRRDASARRADYDPTQTLPEPDSGRQLGIGFNLPRRMRLDLWEERDGDALDTETLMHLADEFWWGYRKKRWGYMPERGDRMNLPLDKYAQVFRRDLDLTVAETQNLIDFMYVTRLVPEWEARMIADNFQLGYTYAWDRVDA